MSTVIIVLALLAIGVGSIIYLTKKSIIKDTDGDFIPDVVEDRIEETKQTVEKVKQTVERVKEEVSDVVEVAKELNAQVKDVAQAASGKSKSRKGRKPAPKK